MLKIYETTNYEKFELLSFNRDVNKTKFLEASMKKHGWIDAYPMHVMRGQNGNLRIKAGHHRFEVAQQLSIPVKYVVSDDNSTIYELEQATNNWNLNDYLVSFVRSGHPAYDKVKRYRERTGISLIACISMLGGQSAGSAEPGTSALQWANFRPLKRP